MREQAARLGLMPWEWQQLTPAELNELLQGHTFREERQRERDAVMAHHIYAAMVGDKAPSVYELLGRPEPPDSPEVTEAKLRRMFDK